VFLPGGEDHEVGIESPSGVHQYPSGYPGFHPESHAIIGAERVRDGLAERGFRGLTLLVHGLLRSAGMSAVGALVISGVLPALGIGLSALLVRRLDVIGVIVLAGLVVGTILALTTHNARL
jgi:hypothetical protein